MVSLCGCVQGLPGFRGKPGVAGVIGKTVSLAFVCRACSRKALIVAARGRNGRPVPSVNSCVFDLTSPGRRWRKRSAGIQRPKGRNRKRHTRFWDGSRRQTGLMTDAVSPDRVRLVPKEVPEAQGPKESQ